MNVRLVYQTVRLLAALFVVILFSTGIYAQTGIITTGGNATSSSGSVSYSIGQVFYLTHESTAGKIHEGVQQAYEIFTVDVPGVDAGVDISLFPNPANTHFIIRTGEIQSRKLRFQMIDLQGQMLESGDLNETETIIHVNSLSPSGYFINILSDDITIKTFKLIKHSR
jgi:hypothetical protein